MMRSSPSALSHLFLILCLLSSFVYAASADENVYLERGRRGIVPCPLLKSHQIPLETIDAMYWYYVNVQNSRASTTLLISYFLTRVAPQNGIPEGVYDIDDEFNLVIENVTASNEGTYFFEVKPHFKALEDGQVQVYEKVSPSRLYPSIVGCNQDMMIQEDTCDVRIGHGSDAVHNLTCIMEQVKPAVELKWLRARPHGYEKVDAVQTITHVNPSTHMGLSLKNNTYSSSASIQVSLEDDDVEYVCEAVGVAIGNVTRMSVRLTKTHPTMPTTASHDYTTADYGHIGHIGHIGKSEDFNGEVLRKGYIEVRSVYIISPIVMSSISLLCSLVIIILYLYKVYYKNRRNTKKKANKECYC